MSDVRMRVSTLWTVVLFNMLYADVLSFLQPEFLRGLLAGNADGVRITQPLLLVSAVMVEIPILMVALSRTLEPSANRRADFAAVPLTAAFVVGGGSTSPHYLVLAAVELLFLTLVPHQTWRWRMETPTPATP